MTKSESDTSASEAPGDGTSADDGTSTNDDPASFVAGRDRAVVTVWKRFCDPCESVKADLPTVLDAVPEGVAVAGIDGEVATDFCATHGVDAAPGFVLVDDSDRRTITGGDAGSAAAVVRAFFGE